MNKNSLTQNPLISVLVTSYNHERYIRTCIDSVLGQTYPNIEVSVIDDCSTDGSADILRSYGSSIELTVRDKNRGVDGYCDTLNDAIKSARGVFFYRLDSDDCIQRNYFERMIGEYQNDKSLDWICGGLNVIDADGQIKDTWDYACWPTEPQAALARGWHTCSAVVPHNGLFRTSFLSDNKLLWRNFPYGWGADVLFTLQAVQCHPNIKLISGPGFNWRTHGGNNSCDVVRRIELVLAVKDYYVDNVPEALYLRDPVLQESDASSSDYQAARDFLVAADIHLAKSKFQVPAMFRNSSTWEEIENNLYRFDAGIRKYAERSLVHSRKYERGVRALLTRLESDEKATKGQRRLKLGDFQAASEEFKAALRSDPDCARALRGAAEASYQLGDLEAASDYCLKALQLAPNDSRILNNAGVILFARGEYAPAERAFRKAITADPQCADSHLNLLQLYGTLAPRTPPEANRGPAILHSTRWISENYPDESRLPLMSENYNLRDSILKQFADSYAHSEERILLHRPENGALKYLFDSWAEVLNHMGLKTELMNWGVNTGDMLEGFQPTAFITVADPIWAAHLDGNVLKQCRRERGLKIGHITTLKHRVEPCDFYITFHLDPSSDTAFDVLDRPLLTLPFAANPLQHFMRPGREIWDFFFVGTNSHLKVGPTNEYLMPIVNSYEGILAGTNWPVGIGELPVPDAALLYSFARIYPNFHLKSNFESYNELCERTYIIPACGGFELSDNPVAMKELFADDEMAVAGSPSEYREMFEHFLQHPDERVEFIRKGMRRVYSEYTLFHILTRLANHLGAKAAVSGKSEDTPVPVKDF